MAIDVTNIKCDINGEPDKRLQFKQFDNLSRVIYFELTDDGSPLDISGCQVSLYAKKPDCTCVFQTCEVIDGEYGQLRVAVKEQLLSCSGEVLCEIVISGEGCILTTRSFVIEVLPCVRDETAIASDNDYSDLQQLICSYDTCAQVVSVFADAYDSYVIGGGSLSFSQWLALFKGEKGDTGIPGSNIYVHIAYADSLSPSEIFDTADGHSYIGFYSGQLSAAPTAANAYSWARFKGDDGEKGDTGVQGVQGVAGNDGITPYIGGNFNWFVGSQDTGVDARGIQGEPGITLVEYANENAYRTAVSSGLVAENQLSYWGQG